MVAAGAGLARVFPARLAPLWFGPAPGTPPLGRFDDPARHTDDARNTFGVCYLGRSREAAFAESLLRRPRTRLLSRATLDARGMARLAVTRPLRLVSLHGPGLAVVHATAAVTHGPHAIARRWAHALWLHPEAPDGIAYRCRHDDDELAVALFDRASASVAEVERRGLRADRGWLGATLDRYGVALED